MLFSSHTAFYDHLQYITGSPNASPLDVVLVQAESSLNIRNNTLPHLSADTSDLNLSTDDDAIVALSQEQNYKVRLTVSRHNSSLNPIFSKFNSSAVPDFLDRSFLHLSKRNHIRLVVKLILKSTDLYRKNRQADSTFW